MSKWRNSEGFSLIELMIVVGVIAIIAAIAVPNLITSRKSANESAVFAVLKNLASAQAQCQAAVHIDGDRNGTGEFGYFAELSGVRELRDSVASGSPQLMIPPTLSAGFSRIDDGTHFRSGYTFWMFLPGPGGAWVPEAPSGGAVIGSVNAQLAESIWFCYCWPNAYDVSGQRAYIVNQSGDVFYCRNAMQRYSGSVRRPVPGTTGFLSADSMMDGTLAANTISADGERWLITY